MSSKEKEKSESNNRKLEKEDNKEDIVATKNDKFISEKKEKEFEK